MLSDSTASGNTPSAAPPLPDPWVRAWPADGIEAVEVCPLCGDASRTKWHEGLVDSSFRVSPGRWRLWRCIGCTAAYLDPRPTAATIHAAYASYYTHTPAAAPPANIAQRIQQWLSNGYAKRRYGSRRVPAAHWGAVAARLVPLIGKIADREFRHLPATTGQTRSVLDVGCGDGGFLAEACACGWKVLGLEPDPKAAAIAKRRGVPVHLGGLECLNGQAQAFDVITLSHVIEHVPDPVQTLRDCWRLLKSGGQLWLETPNVNSLGHQVFGPNWRGLEAPRHLVLFSPAALQRALSVAGFTASRVMPSPSARRWIFKRSLAIAQGRLPDDVRPLPVRLRRQVAWADLCERPGSPRREFLTVVAVRA